MSWKLTQEQLNELAPEPNEYFRIGASVVYSLPHPYCIGPKHVKVASDFHCGVLGEAAIRDAEKRGAVCDICKQNNRKLGTKILSLDEHEQHNTLQIILSNNVNQKDLNNVPGLREYLVKIKDKATNFGVAGFAFPTEQQYSEEKDD